MALIQTVHLSMANFKSAPVVPAVQNDTDRQVKMIIDDYTLTSGLTGKIAFERSDGTHYETAAELVLADNAFTADIDQALTQPGRTMVQLKVTDTLTVSSFSFVIFVEEDTSGTITPQEGIDLVTAVAAAEDAADRAESAAETLELDDTLTSPTKAAQSKAVGDAVSKKSDGLVRTSTGNPLTISPENAIISLTQSGSDDGYDKKIVYDGSSAESWGNLETWGSNGVSRISISLSDVVVGEGLEQVFSNQFEYISVMSTVVANYEGRLKITVHSTAAQINILGKTEDFSAIGVTSRSTWMSYLASHPLTVWYRSTDYNGSTAHYLAVGIMDSANKYHGVGSTVTVNTGSTFDYVGNNVSGDISILTGETTIKGTGTLTASYNVNIGDTIDFITSEVSTARDIATKKSNGLVKTVSGNPLNIVVDSEIKSLLQVGAANGYDKKVTFNGTEAWDFGAWGDNGVSRAFVTASDIVTGDNQKQIISDQYNYIGVMSTVSSSYGRPKIAVHYTSTQINVLGLATDFAALGVTNATTWKAYLATHPLTVLYRSTSYNPTGDQYYAVGIDAVSKYVCARTASAVTPLASGDTLDYVETSDIAELTGALTISGNGTLSATFTEDLNESLDTVEDALSTLDSKIDSNIYASKAINVNKPAFESGYLLADGTTVIQSSSYKHSPYIEVEGGRYITVKNFISSNGVKLHIYNSAQTQIKAIRKTSSESDAVNISSEDFYIPEAGTYIRFSCGSGESLFANTNVIYKNNDYKWYLPEVIINNWRDKSDSLDELFAKQTQYPIITFVDDDTSSVADINRYITACETAGVKGTFACGTRIFETEDTSKDILLNAEKSGHQVVLHCYIHGEYYRYSSDPAYYPQVEADFVRGLHDLLQAGFANPRFWVTPFGSATSQEQELAKKWGMKALATTVSGYEGTDAVNRWYLHRATLNPADTETITYANLINLSEECAENNGWLIILTHFNNWQGSDITRFTQFVTDVTPMGFKFMTLGEAWTIRKPIYDWHDFF